MPTITEIAPDIYRISTYVPEIDLQFNQFLVKDDQPLLYHTGTRAMFPLLLETVTKILDPSTIRWIGFSHFEADECGALNNWLEAASSAEAVCTFVGALVSVNDFATRPAHILKSDDVLTTGKYHYRLIATPHLPHGWDAGMLFEETQRTLFCSDLFHQVGDVEPSTESDLIGRFRETLTQYQSGHWRTTCPTLLTRSDSWQDWPLSNRRPLLPCTARPLLAMARRPYSILGRY